MDETRLTVGEIIAGTFAAIAARPRPYLVYIVGMTALATGLEQMAGDAVTMPINMAGVVAGFALLSHLFAAEGRPSRRTFGAGFLSYFGASFLSGLGMLLGFILLVAPGIYLMGRWSVATGLVVAEDEVANRSLARSWDLTRASHWALFGAALVCVVVSLAILGLLGAATGAFEAVVEDAAVVPLGQSLAINAATQVLGAIGTGAVMFLTQRLAPSADGLQDVFE